MRCIVCGRNVIRSDRRGYCADCRALHKRLIKKCKETKRWKLFRPNIDRFSIAGLEQYYNQCEAWEKYGKN